jgi:hypothetical protein
MTDRSPAPLAAAVGLAAATADGLRRLPSTLVGIPFAAVRRAGAVRQAASDRYDELALHGRDVLAGRHRDTATLARLAAEADQFVGEVADDLAADDPAAGPVGSGPADAAVPPLGRTEPVVVPEPVLAEVATLTPGEDLAHGDLPLPDFDHLTVPQLRGRLRTVPLPELIQLRAYEQAHAGRLPVLTMLDNRIASLAEEPAAQ